MHQRGNGGMKNQLEAPVGDRESSREEELDRELRRANARLNHFRGVAVSVLGEAQRLLSEIWGELQDSRSYEQILEGNGVSLDSMSPGDGSLLHEKLHLLGIQIDYAKRLCNGSIGNESQKEGEK
jgi:hypothetical protein